MSKKNQDKLTVLIIQSGAMGDIYLVAPIARHYALNGYCVFWPVREPYFNLVEKYFPYVSAGLVDEEKYPKLHDDWLRSDTMHLKKLGDSGIYDLVINLADRGIKPLQLNNETFEETKYRIAGVPIHYRNHLLWTRNEEKENEIAQFVTQKYSIDITKDKFVLAHLESSNDGKEPIPEDEKRIVVEVEKVPGCEIADWFLVASFSKAIYAVESSFHQFIEGSVKRLISLNSNIELYLLSRSSLAPGTRYTNSWDWDKKYMK
jgi:hypothetical protein